MPSLIAWTVSVSNILIAVFVWRLFNNYAGRVLADADTLRRFALASAAFLFGWLVLAFALGAAGVFQGSPTQGFPTIALGIGLPIVIGLWLLYRSPVLRAVTAAIPTHWLVVVQLYRILGVVFLSLYALGLLPGEFAIPAGWGDVAVGTAAPVIGYLLYKGIRGSRGAAVSWSVIGILDLLVAVTTGFLTGPGPLQMLALQHPNVLVSSFPLVLVPVFAVPLSILLHVAALSKLKAEAPLASHKGRLAWTT
jgi:hypothetical protein